MENYNNNKDEHILGRLETCPPSAFYNKNEATTVTIGQLPHWSQSQKIYAVTFRLHDSLPNNVVKAYVQECELMYGEDIPNFKTKREAALHKKMMEYMDAGYGECLLKDKKVRHFVEQAFCFIDNNKMRVHAYVIMPNHVHAVLETLENMTIQQVMHSLKRHTSSEINQWLHREGAVWQREYYDRIIRNNTHYENAINYIRNNPRFCNNDEYTLGGQVFNLPKNK